MATETGVIRTVTSSTTGTIDRDPVNASPDPVGYDDPTLNTRNIVLTVGDKVSYDIDLDANVTNITPVVTDPEPADEGTIKTGTVAGFTVATGQVVTVKSGIITGNIIMNGGKLILKTNTVLKESIHAHRNAELLVYNSTVEKRISFSDSTKQVIIHNGSVGGDVDVRNASKIIHNGSVGGDTDIRNNLVVNIDGLTLTGARRNLDIRNNKNITSVKNVIVNNGNVHIRHNTGCSYSNITAPNGRVDIHDCNAI